jgi:RecB family endonuclease NucS
MSNRVIFADCNVQYEGRAASSLCDGRYLIVIKSDGSLIIHDGQKLKPKNYIGPKAKIVFEDDQVNAVCKKESIRINLLKVYHDLVLDGWDSNGLDLVRTEFELRDKLADDVVSYLGVTPVSVEREVQASYGKIDLLVLDSNEVYHIIEVKRGQASISACSQLYRYYSSFCAPNGCRFKGYIAAPRITDSGLRLLEEYGLGYIKIDF